MRKKICRLRVAKVAAFQKKYLRHFLFNCKWNSSCGKKGQKEERELDFQFDIFSLFLFLTHSFSHSHSLLLTLNLSLSLSHLLSSFLSHLLSSFLSHLLSLVLSLLPTHIFNFERFKTFLVTHNYTQPNLDNLSF